MSFNQDEVRDFLYSEARLLDDRDWDSWLDLYAKDAEFWMPSWDDDGQLTRDPQSEVSLMYYPRRDGLEDRIFRIRTEKSTSSTPDHRTSHNITNIEILSEDETDCTVRFNWITYTMRYKIVDQYFGTSIYQIIRENGKLQIKKKKVILKSDYIHHVIDVYHI
jgi:benzoate/toluate 1,2-dioxygenase beta subunit